MQNRKLKQLLNRLQISQTEFAEELGVTQPTVSRWLSGTRTITLAMEKHIRRTAEELLQKGTAA